MNNTFDNKILMIKYVRALTRVLGKLGLSCLRHESWMWRDYLRNVQKGTFLKYPKSTINIPDKYSYGLSLKESKDFVEAYLGRKTGTTST